MTNFPFVQHEDEPGGQKPAATHQHVETDQKQPPEELGAARQCRHVKADGKQCRANTIHRSVYCFFHDPESAKDRQSARINGGKERSRKAAVLPPNTPDKQLSNSHDVTALLGETINQVRRGELSPNVSNTIGYLAAILLKAKQQDQVEQRLLRLEAILENKWANPKPLLEPTLETVSFEFVNSNSGGEA